MFNLVYASIAVKPFSGSELLALLLHAREKNAAWDITGMLLYKQGSFMQALEGEEAAVRAMFAIIREDERHHHILTLVSMPVAQRQFPTWSMGFKDLDAVVTGPLPGYTTYLDLPPPSEPLSWQASVAMGLLATFRSEN